jgi:hypothetical protein
VRREERIKTKPNIADEKSKFYYNSRGLIPLLKVGKSARGGRGIFGASQRNPSSSD